LELYVHSWRHGGYGRGDIYVARRATQSEPWGEALNLGPVVNSADDVQYPSLSPDGLLLLFCDGPFYDPAPGGYGGSDMWMARRATLSDSWEAPVRLGPNVNGPGGDYTPRISPDGRALYFWSDRGGAANYQAPIIPIVDFNGDGKVDGKDALVMTEHQGPGYPLCDIGPFAWGDGVVDAKDLTVLAEYMDKELVDPTLIAHWALDEAGGAIAHDSAGGNDATLVGSAVWQPESGKVGGALQLSGLANFAVTKLVHDPSRGPFSVLAWVQGGAPGQTILSQAGGANWLSAQPGTGFLMSDLKLHPRLDPMVSLAVITDGAWHHVGFVWDGANRILYVDGVEVTRSPQSALAASTGSLQIGADSKLTTGSFWSGLIDDVRIYSRVVRP
jgi:hypothetical protein